MIARLLPVLLSLLLLAAHALRRGEWGLTAAFVLLAALAFSRRSFARPVLAAALAWGLLLWAQTTKNLLAFRIMAGMPWERLLYIMGGVMALTALGLTLLLTARRLRDWFGKNPERASPQAAAFILTAALLGIARAKSPLPVLLADRFWPGSGWLEIFLLALYAAWAAGALGDPKNARRLRPMLWAFFSAVFFAQLALGLSGIQEMLMTGRLHLPVPALIVGGPLFRGEGFFMPILFAVSVLLVGPAWCSWLCYIGAWDDQASRLPRRPPRNAPGKLLWYGRGAAMLLTVGAALSLRALGVSPGTAVLAAAVFGLAGVGVMLAASRRQGYMVHCATYCPMGLAGNLLGRLSPWRLRIDKGCTQCGVCSHACRYGALTTRDLAAGRPGLSCTLCGDCLPACPHSHPGYAFPGLSRQTARSAFLVMVVSLHAVFLGVARI